jgi:hypothetical protein
MTTKLSKPLVRDVGDYLVRLTVDGVEIREKGRRGWSAPLPWSFIHLKAWDEHGISERPAQRSGKKRNHFKRGFQI